MITFSASRALGDGLASNFNHDKRKRERTTTQIKMDDGCANVKELRRVILLSTVGMAGKSRTEAFREFRFRPQVPRRDRIGVITRGREIRGSDKSEQERSVVQIEIPISGRVPMFTGV